MAHTQNYPSLPPTPPPTSTHAILQNPPNLPVKKSEAPNDFHIPRGYLHIPFQIYRREARASLERIGERKSTPERSSGASLQLSPLVLFSCWLAVAG